MEIDPGSGKVTLLVFCPGYKSIEKSESEALNAVHRLFAERSDFAMFAVCLEPGSHPLTRAYMRDYGLECPQGFLTGHNKDTHFRYGVDNTGSGYSTVVIGKDGRITALGLRGEELGSKIQEVLAKP